MLDDIIFVYNNWCLIRFINLFLFFFVALECFYNGEKTKDFAIKKAMLK